MKHLLHHADECPDCFGTGGTYEDDWDGEAPRKVPVACEGCDSCGSVSSCDLCDRSMPLTEAELLGYTCGPCRADVERGDARDEVARIQRWSA